VFKDGTYGCSLEDGVLYLDLLNGSVYCAHPVGNLPIMDENRFQRYIDLGRHEFKLRLEICDEADLDRKATAFTQKPYALNFYPHGTGERHETPAVTLSDETVTLTCFRKVDADTYMVRLYNGSDGDKTCGCTVFGKAVDLSFGKYEVKTLLYRNGEPTEQRSMLAL
jgi:alpha-mannosidase